MAHLTDTIHLPSTHASSTGSSPHTVVFLPGNPGLISYYHTFLRSLYAKLNDHSLSQQELRAAGARGVTVHGFSHAGFSISPTISSNNDRLYTLEEQIEHAWTRIIALFNSQSTSLSKSEVRGTTTTKPTLSLIGHSVGCYIILSLLTRYHAARADHEPPFTIISCVLLFPTVVDIAKSVMGRRVGWALGLPGLGLCLGALSRWVVWASGQATAKRVVGFFMGLGAAGTSEEERQALSTTVTFLGSAVGVREALYMAADEMRSITADRWDDSIWGTAANLPGVPTSPAGETEMMQRPKQFFYFGRDDRWVADRTRDDLLALRAYEPMTKQESTMEEDEWHIDSRPRMEIDGLGTPHGFCIRNSESIAVVVAGYLRPFL